MIDWITKLLIFMSENDACDSGIFWDTKLRFSVNCNDVFYWGSADSEALTEETFVELKKAYEDANTAYDNGYIWGNLLYCARRRGMRPQGAYYEHIPSKLWPLFNECGEERELDFMNPKPQKDTET